MAFTAVSVLLSREPPPSSEWQTQDALGLTLTCLINAPLLARRKAPVVVCTVACSLWAVFIALDYWPVVNSMGPALALYTVASLCPLRPAVVCTVLVGAVWAYAGIRAEQGSMATVAAQAVVFPAVACRFGIAARISTQRAERLAELARQLRHEQRDRARRAVAEEQRRIARELHDVVAHHMSVVNVQAGMAGYVFDSAPDTARGALRAIAETSHEALGELRRMLTLLRTGPDNVRDGDRADSEEGNAGDTPYAPMPDLARLGEVAERVRAAGVPVDLRIEGEPRSLAPGVQLCAYRVVQEALTNVIKHAPSASATVRVEYRPGELLVHVTDDGRRDRSLPANIPPSSGLGLIGMRERARLYGGAVDVGPRAEGGFSVRLILPTSASAGPGGSGLPG
ncbi:sensor histidine kinase [Streptomyces sp. NPDC052236]|uniref:sensor histidine kinase n=1 Tax=Streptomyces sp. NPDC052236 TaxID=3365686 RepID=UPI0037D80887